MGSDFRDRAANDLSSPSFDKYSLPDISLYVPLNTDEASKARDFLKFIKNPYLFRVGDIGVHVVFSGQPGDTLQSHICNLLASRL